MRVVLIWACGVVAGMTLGLSWEVGWMMVALHQKVDMDGGIYAAAEVANHVAECMGVFLLVSDGTRAA